MSLASGTRLGPYDIQSAIGAGGMGEVYKARDTRLDRTVAIKVLPPDVNGDPERRARFEREAKTIAGLNHPNICVLHDVGDHEGSMFLVMEHLDGLTLAERLDKGALPLDQVLTLGIEIADALSAAHRQGVIHRDLKPANVMLTKAGAKLLDFGLAKLRSASTVPSVAGATDLPTTAPLTGSGLVFGTVPYMSPEQLEGREADARSDLFAFGCMLFEASAGRRAFSAASDASIVAAIMSEQRPDVSALGTAAPSALRRLVHRCLAKDPDARWQNASDVAGLLRWIAEERGSGDGSSGRRDAAAGTVRSRRPWRARLPWALAAAAIAVALVLAAWPRSQVAPRVMHVSLPLPADAPFGTTLFDGIAISRDGQTVAYSSEKGIYVRSLSRDTFRAIPGTENSRLPPVLAGRGMAGLREQSGHLQGPGRGRRAGPPGPVAHDGHVRRRLAPRRFDPLHAVGHHGHSLGPVRGRRDPAGCRARRRERRGVRRLAEASGEVGSSHPDRAPRFRRVAR